MVAVKHNRESEQEDRDDTESDHSIRPVTEREQEDRDEIESDQFIQASPHDYGWVIGWFPRAHYASSLAVSQPIKW